MRGYYENKPRSVEQLVFYMRYYGTAKQTVISLIKKALNFKYIFKTKDLSDKRKVLVSPTKKTVEEFENWSKKLASGLNFK